MLLGFDYCNMQYMTGYQLMTVMQQVRFPGLTGDSVGFRGELRFSPLLEYYQVDEDGSYHFIGNFTTTGTGTSNSTIYVNSSALAFQGDSIPISGTAKNNICIFSRFL